VIVQPVELRDYAPAVELTGEIRASQRALLTAEVGGRITAISARVGEAHRKSSGALIQINPADYQAQLGAAQSQLDQAKAALAEAQAGARPQDIAVQRAQVAAASASLEEALDNLNRQEQLYASGVIPESTLVSARTRVESARQALRAQEEALDRILEGTRVEQLDAAQARVKAAESTVQLAQLNLSKASVSPAFDARVSALMVEVGQSVNPGTPLVEVIADGPGEAWFNLPESEVGRVQSGDSVEIRCDALPGEVISGTVISVSAAADTTTRQFPLRVALKDERLLSGMAVRGRILLGEPRPTLMVSQDATLESKLGLIVNRMTPPGPDDKPMAEGMPALGSFETVPVKTGERIDGMVVILEGDLKPGDMLVTRGKEGLYPTARLVPTNLMGMGGAAAPTEAGTADKANPESAGDRKAETASESAGGAQSK
jgi:HlyD family secretion protein